MCDRSAQGLQGALAVGKVSFPDHDAAVGIECIHMRL